MVDKRFIAVIDIGKTNAKLAIFDPRTRTEVAVRTQPNKVLSGPPYPHFDVSGIRTFLLDALKELNRTFPVSDISITTHGASLVLLDSRGELAMPMLDYEHDGPDTMAAEYDAARPEFAETGSPRLPIGLNAGAQLFWQKSAFSNAFAKVAHILTYPQYWGYLLTGKMACEVTSLGCHTDMWNPWKQTFTTMMHEQGWAEKMPPVCKAGDCLGTVLPALAQELGLDPQVRVAAGIHDSNASLYPHLIARKGAFSVVSTGTWVIAMAVGSENANPDPAKDTLVNVNALGEPVPSARFMGGREFETLMAGASNDYTDEDIAAVLEGQIMFLPAIETKSGPFQGRNGGWADGVEPIGARRYVATSFYLALMTAHCLALVGGRGETIVEGPFARNPLFLSMLSQITGRNVLTSAAGSTGTALGAAMLTGRVEIADSELTKSAEMPAKSGAKAYIDRWNALVSKA